MGALSWSPLSPAAPRNSLSVDHYFPTVSCWSEVRLCRSLRCQRAPHYVHRRHLPEYHRTAHSEMQLAGRFRVPLLLPLPPPRHFQRENTPCSSSCLQNVPLRPTLLSYATYTSHSPSANRRDSPCPASPRHQPRRAHQRVQYLLVQTPQQPQQPRWDPQ